MSLWCLGTLQVHVRKTNLAASNYCLQGVGGGDSSPSPWGQGTGWTAPVQQPPQSPPGAYSPDPSFQVQQVHSHTAQGACMPSNSCQTQPGAWLPSSLALPPASISSQQMQVQVLSQVLGKVWLGWECSGYSLRRCHLACAFLLGVLKPS